MVFWSVVAFLAVAGALGIAVLQAIEIKRLQDELTEARTAAGYYYRLALQVIGREELAKLEGRLDSHGLSPGQVAATGRPSPPKEAA